MLHWGNNRASGGMADYTVCHNHYGAVHRICVFSYWLFGRNVCSNRYLLYAIITVPMQWTYPVAAAYLKMGHLCLVAVASASGLGFALQAYLFTGGVVGAAWACGLPVMAILFTIENMYRPPIIRENAPKLHFVMCG